jgi:sec-independent protein translocase protein TatA
LASITTWRSSARAAGPESGRAYTPINNTERAVGMEWVVVAIVALIVFLLFFGARKLPDLARSLGKSSREFKKGMAEGTYDPHQTSTSDEIDNGAEGESSSPS